MTYRQQYEQVKKSRGIAPKELEHGNERPDGLGYIITWWHELRNNLGDKRVNYERLNAWASVFKHDLEAWEARLLMDTDRIYFEVITNGD